MLETTVSIIQMFWMPVAVISAFILGMFTGWLASNASAAQDAEDGHGYIYWRAKRYRVVPDDDPDDERKVRHAHGTMAEQSWS